MTAELTDYMARIEQAVRENVAVGDVRVLAVIEHEISEREGYWERMYFVAWSNAKEAGTHRVSIDSTGAAGLFYGHYQMSEDEAKMDLFLRAGGYEAKA